MMGRPRIWRRARSGMKRERASAIHAQPHKVISEHPAEDGSRVRVLGLLQIEGAPGLVEHIDYEQHEDAEPVIGLVDADGLGIREPEQDGFVDDLHGHGAQAPRGRAAGRSGASAPRAAGRKPPGARRRSPGPAGRAWRPRRSGVRNTPRTPVPARRPGRRFMATSRAMLKGLDPGEEPRLVLQAQSGERDFMARASKASIQAERRTRVLRARAAGRDASGGAARYRNVENSTEVAARTRSKSRGSPALLFLRGEAEAAWSMPYWKRTLRNAM